VAGERAPPERLAAGERLHGDHCADCHRDRAPDRRTLAMTPPNNLVRAIVEGGFGAATPGHPRPHGMPPFGHELDDAQIAAIASWLRAGVGAGEVTPLDVRQAR
jgi:mono/diheme cytochrome c family protein